MDKQIFRLAQSDELMFYAMTPSGRLITKQIHDSGFKSFDQVVGVIMSIIPEWYDEYGKLVCIHIVCEAKGLKKYINKRIPKR
jgi:hypothetical protein